MLSASAEAAALRPIKMAPLPDRPLVSVLMSNYNYGHFLPEAIESVLHQHYTYWELVICDDGSQDNSVTVAERFVQTDSRIKLIAKDNGGQTSGFNAAYQRCSGQIICFLDSDDIYKPTKLARVVEAFLGNPQVGCVVNRVQRVDAKRRPQGPLPLIARLPDGWCAPRQLRNGGVLPDMPPTPGLNFRRAVAEYLFPLTRTPEDTFYPDMLLQRLMPLITILAAVDEPLVEYRLHGANGMLRDRFSVSSIDRELLMSQQLWDVQARFLAEYCPDAVPDLKPLIEDRGTKLQKYIRARLMGDPESEELHRDLMQCEKVIDRPLNKTFWRISRHLPRPLFVASINVLLTQGPLKHLLAKVRSTLSPGMSHIS